MNDPIEEANKIYEGIGKLLWSIFPHDKIDAIYEFQLYDSSNEYTFYWLDSNGEKSSYLFDDSLVDDILNQIREKLKILQKYKLFEKEPWTQCRVTLSDKGEFNIKFAYIPWEDSWPGLYMQGVSELTQEEAYDKYSVPNAEWEKRVKLQKLKKHQDLEFSEFGVDDGVE